MNDDTLIELRENPPHLAKFECGHIQRFVLSPIIGYGEWCKICKNFRVVVDGVNGNA